MTVQQEISSIQKDQYRDYKGRRYQLLKQVHQTLRDRHGDVWFLSFLKKLQEEIPRPKFNLQIKKP